MLEERIKAVVLIRTRPSKADDVANAVLKRGGERVKWAKPVHIAWNATKGGIKEIGCDCEVIAAVWPENEDSLKSLLKTITDTDGVLDPMVYILRGHNGW